MTSSSSLYSPLSFLLLFPFMACFASLVNAGNFDQDVDISWGDGRGKILNNGQLLSLSLDKSSGSGFQSKNEYLFGKIDTQIKLVSGDSAGTVTAYYLSSQGPTHDEVDFEFLGNLSGDPYILHTNLFSQGKGNREVQFYLWFDPTKDFHTYSILWNPIHIVFYVDGIPIREFKNLEATKGVPFPKNQPMKLYASLWDAEDWATRGGLVKTDWTQAPFIASFRNFNGDGCTQGVGGSSCNSKGWMNQELDGESLNRLRWVQKNYMVYNYCSDVKSHRSMANALLLPILACTLLAATVSTAAAGNFNNDFDITWGDGRAKVLNNGQLLTLSLDKASGSGFQSKSEYLFGKIDMQLKLVPGNSAGTVTAYYLSSQGPTHDEIDFEFLGNLSGDPYTLHTNVFTQGKGNREMQFKLWFDPTEDFHTYSVIWNPQQIIFMVDGTPIRVFRNLETKGVAFPKSQAMRIYSSLWNADDWATRGGLIKTDWNKAPFSASYRGFNADACVWVAGGSRCPAARKMGGGGAGAWMDYQMDVTNQKRMLWVQSNYMIYNYCADRKRFVQGLPTESFMMTSSAMAANALLLPILACTLLAATVSTAAAGNFNNDFDITWGDGRAKVLNNGQLLTLSLDKASGSGFQSKSEYLFGKIDMQLKLVPGNSAGTVTAYYLSSQGPTHDEIDFEFLGNLSGDPYTLHTNVFTQGKGNREMQFKLWFDPTTDFHTYSVIWNSRQIIFMVDGTPIRVFRNLETRGVAFPKSQAMRIYSSLWNADDWATRGGLIKTDWNNAPFTASYRGFNADACVWVAGGSRCSGTGSWMDYEMDVTSQKRMSSVQSNYMIYNYCTDRKRFPQGISSPSSTISSAMANALLLPILACTLLAATVSTAAAGNFNNDFDITWGDGRAKILNNGQLLTLSLDKASGSGFQSKSEYLFGKIDMQLKLVPGNSAGTVTAYYLSSQGPTHDEIDFEFLGNLSGDPYTLHTNVFTQGKGNREMQFKLWFDPTKDFHTYSVIWNPRQIIFMVDGTPIRVFRNLETRGVAFPKSQAMRIYSSLWNADDWATRGGLIKTDWNNAPFTASYRGFNADACVWIGGGSRCSGAGTWMDYEMDVTSQKRMSSVQSNYMIYNYCTDRKRFPLGLPTECTIN
ncbi:hypothetical protein M5K25_006100 [Dendrobium thyrsiflorum]|uniref:xyloglucan:xyloglucosyl transferase n=1 Tax=Dendrobium thyrsiflorum TaxID=117978 RepID=A0ABD0VHN7_DENTH